mgnify:FL=1
MIPSEINLNQADSLLHLHYADGNSYALPFEYLRVLSPSAEVRGHGQGQAVLQTGKKYVTITDISPVGHYALKLVFDDGHDSGLYTWDYLAELGQNQAQYWADYLAQLNQAGKTREPSA